MTEIKVRDRERWGRGQSLIRPEEKIMHKKGEKITSDTDIKRKRKPIFM